ncbi:MAG: hypothetical protein RJA70_2188 [Pseudomonadota bacterium]|jgi:predicted Zn-dependent peptidase
MAEKLALPARHSLSNGLRLIVLRMPHAQRAVVHAQLNIGSRYESEEENGLSHFLEHMIYRGTRSYPSAHEQALAFENLGGTLSAATATDMGSMAITVPPHNLSPLFPVFAEIFEEPRFEGITIERGIVSEEILEGLDDEGNSIDPDNLIRADVFRDHPLGLPITGTLEHLKHFTEARLLAHHQKFYTGRNTVLAVASPRDPEEVLRELEQHFSHLPPGEEPRCTPPGELSGPSFRFVHQSASQTALRVGFRGPSTISPQEPAMELLMRLLDDGLATRLYHRICDQRGLCYDVAGHFETYSDSGLIEFSAESGHVRAVPVLTELLSIVSELRAQKPGDAELGRAKQRHQWQTLMMTDTAEEMVEYLAIEEQAGFRRSSEERLAQIQAVTPQDVLAAANTWLTPENLCVVAVGLLKKAQRAELERLTLGYL